MAPRVLALLLATTLACAARPVLCAEIVLEQSALQTLVAEGLFKDEGRLYFKKGKCYAYLENPKVSLRANRIVIESHLSSRLGTEAFGSCIGVGLASMTTVSAAPAAQGNLVRLTDIRIDHVEDSNTRAVLSSGFLPTLPSAVELDVLKAVREMLKSTGKQLQAEVQDFGITSAQVVGNRLSIRFDFKLVGR